MLRTVIMAQVAFSRESTVQPIRMGVVQKCGGKPANERTESSDSAGRLSAVKSGCELQTRHFIHPWAPEGRPAPPPPATAG